jgi:hypothetical protein
MTARFALIAVFLLGSSAAQPVTRSVRGTVTDQYSKPLDHASVQIKDTRTLEIRSYWTQSDGKFHFVGLNRNIDYEFTADYDGIRSSTHRLSKFDSRDEPEITLVVRLSR